MNYYNLCTKQATFKRWNQHNSIRNSNNSHWHCFERRTSNTIGNEENVIVIDSDNKILSAALPIRSLQAPSKENTNLKEHQYQTQESLPPAKPNNHERQHKNKINCNQNQLYIGNLNKDVVEEDLNQLLRISIYRRHVV